MSEEQVFIQCTVGGPVRVYVEDGVIKEDAADHLR